MPKRKRTDVVEYKFLALKLSSFDVAIDSTINYEVREPRHYQDDALVYQFGSALDIEGISTYPEEMAGEAYRLTIYGFEPRH